MKGLTGGIEYLFSKNKVDYLKAYGKIVGPNTINAILNGGGEKEVSAKNILIATGSDANQLPFLPFDEKIIVSSTGKTYLLILIVKTVIRSLISLKDSKLIDCYWRRSHWIRNGICL